MIKIERDGRELNVTKGAYENLYKSLGFKIVGDKKEQKPFVKEAIATEVERPKNTDEKKNK